MIGRIFKKNICSHGFSIWKSHVYSKLKTTTKKKSVEMTLKWISKLRHIVMLEYTFSIRPWLRTSSCHIVARFLTKTNQKRKPVYKAFLADAQVNVLSKDRDSYFRFFFFFFFFFFFVFVCLTLTLLRASTADDNLIHFDTFLILPPKSFDILRNVKAYFLGKKKKTHFKMSSAAIFTQHAKC